MNPQTHLAIDGYIDAIPTPGTTGTPPHTLIHSPADADRIALDTVHALHHWRPAPERFAAWLTVFQR
ncbi:hypothetical protein [Streptomyces lavendulocolor]|uniref:hypothetical protein n=1 Tax=Streptomyces lavendulocolor TaxID=67316 RepID=UPI0033F64CC0